MKVLLQAFFCILVLLMHVGHASAEPLNVGAIIPLTGPGASYGVAIRNGFQLAEMQNPDRFKALHVFWEDSRLDSATAVSAYRKLTTIDSVRAIFVWGAGPADAVVPVAAREGMPTFAITADRSISIGRGSVFRFHYHAADYVKPMAQYIREHNLKRLSLLSAQIAYCEAIAKALRADLGSAVTIEEAGAYVPSETDFRTAVAKLKKEPIDGLLVFLLPGQISAFHQQAEQLGLHKPVLGTDFYDSVDEIRKAGVNIAGAVFPAFVVDPAFRERYIKRFGNDDQLPYAANTFDFFTFLAQVIASHTGRPYSDDALVRELRSAPPYMGVSGEYRYVESPEGSGFDVQIGLKEVKDGNLEYLRMHNPPMQPTR